MRCATCGTENAPDSRFCGGCGAKLAPSSRVAPTAKITDDASYPSQPPPPASIPPQNNYVSGPASIPPQNHAHAPASIPPQNAYPAVPGSIPPSNNPASIPPQSYAPPGSIPPSNNPASIPPQNSFQRAATPIQTPPPGSLKMPTPAPGSLSFAATPRLDQTPTTPSPPAADASRSLVVPPRRPIGLIVFVLLVDLALAGAGAVLLGKGLSEKKTTPKSEQKTQRDRMPQTDAPMNVEASNAGASNVAPANAASNGEARASNIETSSGAKAVTPSANIAAPSPSTPVVAAAPTATKSAAQPSSNSKGAAPQPAASTAAASAPAAPSAAAPAPQPIATPPAASRVPAPTTPAPAPTTPTPVPTSPAPAAPTPAPKEAEVSFDTQLERATAASKAAFDSCAADAGSPHGTVRVAFRVLEDGSVANAFPVEDSTGTPSLGQCLAQTITTWRFTPHTGAPINSLRAFNYP